MDADIVSIKCFADIDDAQRSDAICAIDDIFFSSSLKKEFSSTEEREAFRSRWMGQYQRDFPDMFFIASRNDAVVGYLAGYIPVAGRERRFEDQPHTKVFDDLLVDYPAHLHINLATEQRSRGIGSRLVGEFIALCRELTVPGVHVVTGNGSRNNSFYRRVGFCDEVCRKSGDLNMIFMGQRL